MWYRIAQEQLEELPLSEADVAQVPEPKKVSPLRVQQSLQEQVMALRPQMAQAAQVVYDEWDQDDEGMDEHYGGGGICDDIADAMLSVVSGIIPDADTSTIYDESIGHTSGVVYRDTPAGREAVSVDISPYAYERGSFYSWKKIPNVVFGPQLISVEMTNYDDDVW